MPAVRQPTRPSISAARRATLPGRSRSTATGSRWRRATPAGRRDGETKSSARQSPGRQPVSRSSWRNAAAAIASSASSDTARRSMPVWRANFRGIDAPNHALSTCQVGWTTEIAAMPSGRGEGCTTGINWFCCGYARALELVTRRWAPRLDLGNGGYAVIVVATRISRITDYGDPQTGGLFGDMATATLLAPLDGRRHGVHFELVHADASRQPAARPAFDFQARADVPVPAPDGGKRIDERRVVYTLDGMAIAELAPREMAAAVASALAERGLDGRDVDHVVPHQAGTGIVNFAAMKLDDHGVRCEVVNGLTRGTGNTSACSIPHALRERWDSLHGLVACPAAAVGSPGRAEVLRGCVLLRSTPLHDRRGAAAA